MIMLCACPSFLKTGFCFNSWIKSHGTQRDADTVVSRRKEKKWEKCADLTFSDWCPYNYLHFPFFIQFAQHNVVLLLLAWSSLMFVIFFSLPPWAVCSHSPLQVQFLLIVQWPFHIPSAISWWVCLCCGSLSPGCNQHKHKEASQKRDQPSIQGPLPYNILLITKQ